jgi:hypothetical protein
MLADIGGFRMARVPAEIMERVIASQAGFTRKPLLAGPPVVVAADNTVFVEFVGNAGSDTDATVVQTNSPGKPEFESHENGRFKILRGPLAFSLNAPDGNSRGEVYYRILFLTDPDKILKDGDRESAGAKAGGYSR